MSTPDTHVSVLFDQVMAWLAPHDGGRYIDATLGAGGHSAGILESSMPTGRLLGLDADPLALKLAAKNLARFGERATLVQANFEHLQTVALANGFAFADGIVLDLGLSSMQLADAERGFSFTSAGALDMRFGAGAETTAADLLNSLDEEELANLIYTYGEEPFSRRIARALVNARPFATATELADVIERVIGRRGKIHPATKTFQALRMVVNRELEVLGRVLPQFAETLAVGGRVAVISFHSLEDRAVKHFFRAADNLHVLTKHPVRPTYAETVANPRSRSAKLRVAERIV